MDKLEILGIDQMPKEKTAPARGAPRGALSAGCGMWAPIDLAELGSKPSANAARTAQVASNKEPWTNLHSRTGPKGQQKCGLCLHLIAESATCRKVDGQIIPDGNCTLWTRRT